MTRLLPVIASDAYTGSTFDLIIFALLGIVAVLAGLCWLVPKTGKRDK
ncbi:MAG: hypothetical protein ACI89L_000678 [Phycisphaerales bacterium]|jgi:hypothetical protein